MKPIILHDCAIEELWDAVGFYEQQSPGLGLDFEDRISNALKSIHEFPTLWPLDIQYTRRIILQKFPYSIFYLDLPENIWVVAIAHQSRKPFYWLSRLD